MAPVGATGVATEGAAVSAAATVVEDTKEGEAVATMMVTTRVAVDTITIRAVVVTKEEGEVATMTATKEGEASGAGALGVAGTRATTTREVVEATRVDVTAITRIQAATRAVVGGSMVEAAKTQEVAGSLGAAEGRTLGTIQATRSDNTSPKRP